MRTRARPALTAAVGVMALLAGCGSPAARGARATQNPTASATASSSPSPGATATPAPTAPPAPTPKPAPPALIALTEGRDSMQTISLVGLDGTVVASTTLPRTSINGWPRAGPDGAYWLDSTGTLRRLGRDGSVTAVATMPLGSFFAAGPGGEGLVTA